MIGHKYIPGRSPLILALLGRGEGEQWETKTARSQPINGEASTSCIACFCPLTALNAGDGARTSDARNQDHAQSGKRSKQPNYDRRLTASWRCPSRLASLRSAPPRPAWPRRGPLRPARPRSALPTIPARRFPVLDDANILYSSLFFHFPRRAFVRAHTRCRPRWPSTYTPRCTTQYRSKEGYSSAGGRWLTSTPGRCCRR